MPLHLSPIIALEKMENNNKKKDLRIEQKEEVSQGQMDRETYLLRRVKKLISAMRWKRGVKKAKSRQLVGIRRSV